MTERLNAASYFVDRHLEQGRGRRIAIECAGQKLTYEDLFRRINQFGNALRRSLGVRMEERILLLLLDGPEFAYAFWGAIKIGAVPVPVNTLLKPQDYQHLLNDCRARVIVVSEALLHLVERIPRAELPFLQEIIVAGAATSPQVALSDVIAPESAELNPAPTLADDAAFWLYSSGSTGFPKGCVHLQHDLLATTEQYAKAVLHISESDRFFSTAKLFFAYGLGNSLYFPSAVAATSILSADPPSPKNIFETIERGKPTLFFSSPSIYAALLNHTVSDREYDLSSIRCAVSAGEALPAALFARFKERFGIEILDGIGSTEALHMFMSNRIGAARPGSSGTPIPGCECKLLNEQGGAVAPGEIGELWVKYDATCSHYWNQHEKTKHTIHGDWLYTGDKYRQDADGYFWHAGRADDMLKVSGVWVSPTEIEAVLIEHQAVAEVAVVARQDQDELTKPAAWVVLRDGISGSPELARQLQDYVVSRLAVYKRPRWVEFTSALPKTATGKIQRYKLRHA